MFCFPDPGFQTGTGTACFYTWTEGQKDGINGNAQDKRGSGKV